MIRYHCPECDLEVNKSECPICGNRTKVESKLYWCENCNVPIYEEICPECHAKGKYFTSDVRPVFPEERLLLEILLDKPLAFIEDSVWNGVGNRYYVNGKKITFSIAEAIKKDPNVVREKLAQYEAQNTYHFFNQYMNRWRRANSGRFNEMVSEAKQFINDFSKKYMKSCLKRKYSMSPFIVIGLKQMRR